MLKSLSTSLIARGIAALHEIGREWNRVSADPHVWRQALPVDPSLGEYPSPARSARPCSPVRARRGTRRAAAADRNHEPSETPLTTLGRAGQALKRLVFGPPLDVSTIAMERMRKLVVLPVLSADALPSVAYGPRRCWPSWSWPACQASLTRCPSAQGSCS